MADEQDRKQINKKLAKPLVLTAGIIGLVQGLAWTVFSVLCICSYAGSIEIEASNANETEYYKLIYIIFLNANTYNSNNNNLIIKPREFLIFSCFYLVFSIVWSCVSGSIVWAMIHDKWNLSKSLFGTWSITAILTSIVDMVLMGLVIADYITLKNGSDTAVLVCYGIVMSIAARGYVLWIINVVFAVIMIKLTTDIILRENKGSTLPVIHGFETNDIINPPWFNNSVKDFWANAQPVTPNTDGGYDNHGFARSQSFFTTPIQKIPNHTTPNNIYKTTPSNIYDATPNNIYNANPNNIYNAIPSNNNRAPPSTVTNNPMSFSEAIANRTATIGKNKGRRSPLYHVPPPVIPDPDYTPPGSPNGLKSVLRSTSNYNQPLY